MGWRRGEIWLDAEVVWFRERSGGPAASLALHAPAFFGLAPAAAAIPNGLAASRQRRAELRRRRHARKTRVAALVIGPAVVLAVAGPRVGGGARAGEPLQDDPPSQTFRQGPTGLEVAELPLPRQAAAPGTGAATAPSPTSGRRAPAQEASFPSIRWNRASSRGLPYSGSLAGGTQLPVEGPDWVTWNPVEDSVPNQPRRLYGNEHTIRRVVSVLAAYRAANADAQRVVVGDLSFRSGGPMEQHRSHQNGLDVDVYYPRLDGWLRAPVRRDQVDRKLAQALVDGFVAAGATKIFVGFSTGLHGPSGVVVPYPNHEDHLHVRFPPPAR